jgi:DNA-directed RNA polymerase specialized sigma24 family protein
VLEVCARFREETARYLRGEAESDQYNQEVIRRAVMDGDDICWRELYTVYHDQVLHWCRQAGARWIDDPEEMVALTWEKFWRCYTPEKLAASPGAGGALRYLKMCARSVVIDAARRRAALQRIDLGATDHADASLSPDESLAEEDARLIFWEIVESCLRDEREHVLVTLMFEVGLRSADVQAARPELFPTVADVYRTTRNILDRLRRNRDLQAWLAEGGLDVAPAIIRCA